MFGFFEDAGTFLIARPCCSPELPLHVRLARTDPDLADGDVLEGDGVLPFTVIVYPVPALAFPSDTDQ